MQLLNMFIEDLIKVSKDQFGEGDRTQSLVNKIRKELIEVEAEPHDLEEWIDVIILAIDGYWRHGGNADSLMDRLYGKLIAIRYRVYKEEEDGTFQHVVS